MKAVWELGGGLVEIPPRYEKTLPEPGPEGKTPQWFRAVKKTQKLNKVGYRASYLISRWPF